MKAILVIDVDDKYLSKEISLIKFTDDNAIYCNAELKPMPRKRRVLLGDEDKTNVGWNFCINEILGETE